MRVMVTGGAGFLGSHVCEALLARGHRVCSLDDFFRGKRVNLDGCRGMPDFFVARGDCTELKVLESAEQQLGGVDVILHLAAINGTRWFHERPDLVIRVNIDGTRAATDFAISRGARLVFTSSPEAFGEQTQMPLQEDSDSVFPNAREHQRHSYGASKYLGEILVQHGIRDQGLDARIVRPFNAYGPRLPGDDYGQVVSIFLTQCLKELPITLHGDGSQTRSFTYVEDVVEALVAASELDEGLDESRLSGASFNISSGEEVTIRELAELVLEVSGSSSEIVSGAGHPGDSVRRTADVSAAESALGWKPTVDLRSGLERTWGWLQEGV